MISMPMLFVESEPPEAENAKTVTAVSDEPRATVTVFEPVDEGARLRLEVAVEPAPAG